MLFVEAFVFGAIVGSFLNVCIYRIPAGQSVVWPASRCPACRTPIRPYDNIPLIGYAILRGRCRACAAPISLRYPLIETLTALTALAALWRWGLSVDAFVGFAFAAVLIVVTFIDFDHQIIPDVISLPGIVVGVVVSALRPQPGLVDAGLGVLLGGGILYAVAVGYEWITGREGMGGGDVKLLAMIGAFLGWRAIPVTLLLGSLSGSLVGIALMLGRGVDSRVPIPFGPFLAAGAVCALFFGDALIHWYLRLAFGV